MSLEDWIYPDVGNYIGQYLEMSDEELRAATAAARGEKIKAIRKWSHALTEKQRYCLARWVMEQDERYA